MRYYVLCLLTDILCHLSFGKICMYHTYVSYMYIHMTYDIIYNEMTHEILCHMSFDRHIMSSVIWQNMHVSYIYIIYVHTYISYMYITRVDSQISMCHFDFHSQNMHASCIYIINVHTYISFMYITHIHHV